MNVEAGDFSNLGDYSGTIPGLPSGYSPGTDYSPVLFDQSHLVAGS